MRPAMAVGFRMVSQLGNVDWFCFWLKGEEDPDPNKTEQHARRRELRKVQAEEEKKSRPSGTHGGQLSRRQEWIISRSTICGMSSALGSVGWHPTPSCRGQCAILAQKPSDTINWACWSKSVKTWRSQTRGSMAKAEYYVFMTFGRRLRCKTKWQPPTMIRKKVARPEGLEPPTLCLEVA